MRWDGRRLRQWWIFSSLVDWAPVVTGLVIFALIRVGIAAAVVCRGGWPTSVLGWSGIASSVGAASQAVAVAVLLPAVRRRRPLPAVMIGAAGAGTAIVDAVLWVVVGGAAEPTGYAWQLVLAVIFTLVAAVLCRTGFGSAADWPRITQAMQWLVGIAIAVAAVGGAAALAVEQPVAVDRLMRLITVAGLACAASATFVVLVGVGEKRRIQREARVTEMYRQLSGPGSVDR